MSLLADALQPYLIRGIMALKRTTATRLPDVLILSQNAGYDLDFAGQSLLIDFRQSGFLTRTIVGDSCRFVSAAFQTIAKVQSEIVEKDTLPWSLIRLYYAAFYAAHALIRLFGESCSHFDSKHVSQVTALASLQGKSPTFSVGTGLYHCVVGASASGFEARSLGGGPHESFWGIFANWLATVAKEIASRQGSLTIREAQGILLILERLKVLTGNARLSATRNRLQYRHEFDVWFPATLHKRDREALGRLVSQWVRDPMSINLQVPRLGELGEFVIGCTFVLALCRTVLKRIEERATVGARSFVHFGPLAIIGRAEN
jgi:hypothetical protein